MTKTRFFETRHDLASDVRKKVVAVLNQQLADCSDLHSQVKQAHWNVKGMQFMQLHELFDKLAASITASIDEIAERTTALGGQATGTIRQAAAASRLPEFPHDITDGRQHVEALADRYANLAKTTRAAIDTTDKLGDADTADLLTGISRDLDKHLWFLEAHLQG